MIPVAKWVGEKKNSVGGSGGGQDMVFYCESTEGATKGMTTVLTLGGDGSVTMIGLHKGIWYRSNQFNEPQKADVTIQGFVDGGSFIDDYHLYRDGQKVVMISHSLGMTCRSR